MRRSRISNETTTMASVATTEQVMAPLDNGVTPSLGLDNPTNDLIRLVVSECSKAVVQGLGGAEAHELAEREEEDDDFGSAGTIMATATVCFGLRVADCYIVKLYRHLKYWELGLSDEQRGNLKRN